MIDVTQRIEGQWWHAQSAVISRSCETCGAPLDLKNPVSNSRRRDARLRDAAPEDPGHALQDNGWHIGYHRCTLVHEPAAQRRDRGG